MVGLSAVRPAGFGAWHLQPAGSRFSSEASTHRPREPGQGTSPL